MNTRRRLLFAACGLVTGATGAGLGLTLRLHSVPRLEPFLTDDHLTRLTQTPLPGRSVLFIGNSMILRHDIPARVARIAAQEKIDLSVATAAAHGARLIESVRLNALRFLIERGDWSAIVLQDFTKTPLRAADRWGSAHAIRQIAADAGAAQIVLFPPWPAAADSAVYNDAGRWSETPRDPRHYAQLTMEFYVSVAEQAGLRVAPVPERWLQAAEKGAPLFAPDGHHASAAGADLAARILWDSLRPVLAVPGGHSAPRYRASTGGTAAESKE